MLHFETSRLIMRPFTRTDLPAFLAYRSDPEVAQLQGWTEPYTQEMAEAFLQEMSTIDPGAPGEWYQIALQEKSSQKLIGDMAFKLLSADPRQAEIGLTLAVEFQGKGYGQEAVERILVYLFDELKLHRVIATTDVLNRSAHALLEKMGFHREAHFRENLWFKGRWSSEYWYAMLDKDWKESRQLVNS